MAHHHHHHHQEECVTQENTSIHNWWNDLHACSLPSWSTTSCSSRNTYWQNHDDQSKININSHSDDQSNNSSGDENLSISTTSFTNVSNQSDLSAESAGNDQFVGDTVVGSSDHQNQLWNHLLLGVGCREEIQTQDFAGGIFNPTCNNNNNNNYSTLLPSFNAVKNHHHHLNLLGENSIIIGSPKEPIIKSSDMAVDVDMINNINNWQKIPHHDSTTSSSIISNDFLPRSSDHHDDHNMMMTMMMRNSSFGGSVSCFGQEEDEQAHVTRGNNNVIDQYSRTHRSLSSYAGAGLFPAVQPSNGVNSRSFSCTDQVVQNRRPLMLDINLSKPFLKTQLDLSSSARCRKQGFRNSPFPSPTSKTATKRNGRTQGNDHQLERKGRSSLDDNSESVSKKAKQETSGAAAVSSSSTKMQVPKVKLGDKITALQQIVSPFGKTDTASVLWEAIGYIRFLQEQIQLLSTPYLKGCASKEIWGGLERKEIREGKADLRSRGLCLVPISCTSQVYPDNVGSDFLTPVYRGCLYR